NITFTTSKSNRDTIKVLKFSKQTCEGRKFAKGESSVQRDPLFDELPEDTADHMDLENARDEGRTKEMVNEDKEIEGTKEQVESTDGHKKGTEEEIATQVTKEHTVEHIEGTEEQVESTDGHKKGTEEEIATQVTQTSTQTPSSIIFRDDETIAKVLLNVSQAKVVSKIGSTIVFGEIIPVTSLWSPNTTC
ncbi:hypothetical protein Tco_1442717, partial [Tanacetum coccineum]